MNRIEFKQIRVRNFLVIGENEVILDFDSLSGFIRVTGVNYDDASSEGISSNGSGKSSLLTNSILVGLYGKTINNINNRYIPNRIMNPSDSGHVIINLIKNGNESYEIECTIKTNKKRDACSLTYSIKKNGELITLPSKQGTLKYIETDIIGCDYEIFKNTMVISSSNLINFFEMPKAIKNKYLEGIFNLSAFGNSHKIASSKLLDIKKNIKYLSTDYSATIKTKEALTEQFNNWQTNNKAKIDKLVQYIKEELNKTQELDIQKPDNYEKKLSIINKKSELLEKIDKAKKQYNKVLSELNTLNANKLADSTILNKNADLLNTVCSDCKKAVKNLFNLNEIESRLPQYVSKIAKYNELKQKIDVFLDKASNTINKIHSAELEISQYNNNIKLAESHKKNIEQNINNAKSQLQALEQEQNPFIDIINENKSKEIELKTSLDNAIENQEYFNLVKDLFSEDGIKQYVLNDIVDALNARISYYLNKMGATFIVQFDNTLQYSFATTTGTCEYHSFSAGERKRLDLAVLFAFRDILTFNSIQTNILVIDEILDSAIDTACLNSVIQILKDKVVKQKQIIFVISHRESLSNNELFNNTLTVIKENRKVRITVDGQ